MRMRILAMMMMIIMRVEMIMKMMTTLLILQPRIHLITCHLVYERERLEYVGLVVLHHRSIDHHLIHDIVSLIEMEHDL